MDTTLEKTPNQTIGFYFSALETVSKSIIQAGYNWENLKHKIQKDISRGVPPYFSALNEGIAPKDMINFFILFKTSTEFYQIQEEVITPEVGELIPLTDLRKLTFCPLYIDNDVLHIALGYWSEFGDIKSRLSATVPHLTVEGHLTLAKDVQSAIQILDKKVAEQRALKISQNLTETKRSEEAPSLQLTRQTDESELVNQIISLAVQQGASDIHLDPTPDGVWVRYRIDGQLLSDPKKLDFNVGRALINHIKTNAQIDISNNLGPQDGRMAMTTRGDGEKIDLRVASIYTSVAEPFPLDKLTLRILSSKATSKPLSDLGFDDELIRKYRNLLKSPSGMILVTGPIGSGKTTTLYSSLNEIYSDKIQILTIEDPVEYKINGITQIPIKPHAASLDQVLKGVLRHDADVFMVGEIRTEATANMALGAAITGRLLLSTLHTPRASVVPARLRDMGIENYRIGGALTGVLAQRLIKKLCDCKIPEDNVNVIRSIGWSDDDLPEVIYHPNGCLSCNSTGYKGREAVGELLVVDDDISRLLSTGITDLELEKVATEKGMVTLRESIMKKVAEGITSPEELASVVYTIRD